MQISSLQPSIPSYLGVTAHEKFNGDVKTWFEAFVSLDRPMLRDNHCWHTWEGVRLCNGTQQKSWEITLSLPMLLILRVEDNCLNSPKPRYWNFPPTLRAPHDTTYRLIGVVLFNHKDAHLVAHFASEDGKTVYTYNDQNNGRVMIEANASVLTHLAGKKPKVPKGFQLSAAFYALSSSRYSQNHFFKMRLQELE